MVGNNSNSLPPPLKKREWKTVEVVVVRVPMIESERVMEPRSRSSNQSNRTERKNDASCSSQKSRQTNVHKHLPSSRILHSFFSRLLSSSRPRSMVWLISFCSFSSADKHRPIFVDMKMKTSLGRVYGDAKEIDCGEVCVQGDLCFCLQRCFENWCKEVPLVRLQARAMQSDVWFRKKREREKREKESERARGGVVFFLESGCPVCGGDQTSTGQERTKEEGGGVGRRGKQGQGK